MNRLLGVTQEELRFCVSLPWCDTLIEVTFVYVRRERGEGGLTSPQDECSWLLGYTFIGFTASWWPRPSLVYESHYSQGNPCASSTWRYSFKDGLGPHSCMNRIIPKGIPVLPPHGVCILDGFGPLVSASHYPSGVPVLPPPLHHIRAPTILHSLSDIGTCPNGLSENLRDIYYPEIPTFQWALKFDVKYKTLDWLSNWGNEIGNTKSILLFHAVPFIYLVKFRGREF